jgi:hypothetical protein
VSESVQMYRCPSHGLITEASTEVAKRTRWHDLTETEPSGDRYCLILCDYDCSCGGVVEDAGTWVRDAA